MKGGPPRVADECGDREAYAAGIGDRPRTTDLEPEPVTDVHADRLAQFGFSHLPDRWKVDIDVDGRPDAVSRASSAVAPLTIQLPLTRYKRSRNRS
jgi:hypothetical protein